MVNSGIETIDMKWSQEKKNSSSARPSTMVRVIKPAKVPSWTKSLSLDIFTRSSIYRRQVTLMY